MTSRTIPLGDITNADIAAWRALAQRAVEPNVFAEPDFVLPAAQHLGSEVPSLLVVEDRAAWLACLPVSFTRLGGAVRALTSWRHPYCFLDTPLVDRDHVDAAVGDLLDHGAAEAGTWPFALQRLGDDGPVAGAVRAALEPRRLTAVLETGHQRATLHRRATNTYLESQRPHHRRDQERLWRRLGRELGGDLEVTDVAGQPEAVAAFLAMEATGWKGTGGTAMAAEDAHRDFFGEICGRLAASGDLQLLSMGVGATQVAMKCNLRAGDTWFCFKIARDDAYSKFSPGVLLERANVDVFHEQRDELWMDSCADPGNAMINRLWPDRRRITTLVVTRRAARNAAVAKGLQAGFAIRERSAARTVDDPA